MPFAKFKVYNALDVSAALNGANIVPRIHGEITINLNAIAEFYDPKASFGATAIRMVYGEWIYVASDYNDVASIAAYSHVQTARVTKNLPNPIAAEAFTTLAELLAEKKDVNTKDLKE